MISLLQSMAARPCGELRAFCPARRRDKTTQFYFPVGTRTTTTILITENVQHYDVNYNKQRSKSNNQ